MLFASALLFGMAVGGPASIMPSMVGRYFGPRAFATIISISVLPASILLFAALMVAGVVRDQYGTYDAALLGMAAVSLVGGLAFLMMGEPTKRSPINPGVSVATAT